jgi:hypothetical protein
MVATSPTSTIGTEEEYLLVDTKTYALAHAPDALMEVCKKTSLASSVPSFCIVRPRSVMAFAKRLHEPAMILTICDVPSPSTQTRMALP